jgi:choline dehydrogenase-like flavoprotein
VWTRWWIWQAWARTCTIIRSSATCTRPRGHCRENNLLEAQLYARSTHCEGPAPDLQPLLIHIPYPADGYPVPEHGYTIASGLVAPKSRGTLRLAFADPSAQLLADPNILADPTDLEALVEAVELCRDIGTSRAFAPGGPPKSPRAEKR